jgi:hypothetical protein
LEEKGQTMNIETYVEVFAILEWKDDGTGTMCIWKTKSQGHQWIDDTIVKANRPSETQIVYASANDEFARNNMTFRRKHEAQQ